MKNPVLALLLLTFFFVLGNNPNPIGSALIIGGLIYLIINYT